MLPNSYIATSPEDISRILRQFAISPDRTLIDRIQIYLQLLDRWNRRPSLTSLRNPLDIIRIHFAECLFAINSVPIANGRLADVGSGAGFPGVVLKLGRPDLEVILIESNARKCAFLLELIRSLQLNGIDVIRSRYEDLGSKWSNWDFISARALGNYPSLLSWASVNLKQTGNIVLWLGRRELMALASLKGWYWAPPIRIPESGQRFIVRGTLSRPAPQVA